MASVPKSTLLGWVDEFIDGEIIPFIYPEARALIARLNDEGTPILVISASISFLVKPIAKRLGIEHAIGIDLQETPQHFLGEVEGVMSFQEGKVTRLQNG